MHRQPSRGLAFWLGGEEEPAHWNIRKASSEGADGTQRFFAWRNQSDPVKPTAISELGGLESVIQQFASRQKESEQMRRTEKDVELEKTSAQSGLLQQRSVNNVLLACSLYDSYTFEEDGLLAELLFSEHAELHLKKPPNIKRVSTAAEALERLRTGKYDMLISLFRLEGCATGTQLESFLRSVDEIAPNTPQLLVALNPQELARLDDRVDKELRFNFKPVSTVDFERQGSWRRPFLWNGDVSLFVAMIKSVEDRLNLVHDIEVAPNDVKCILLIEDSVQFYSSYLPALYKEILKQSHLQAADTTDPVQRLARIKKRPKVLLATNFEEGLQLYQRFRGNILGVITDAGFPRQGKHDNEAGVRLAKEIIMRSPGVPILLQSSELKMKKHADSLGCDFLHKERPSLLTDMAGFLSTHCGFGDFRFMAGQNKPVLEVAKDVRSLLDCIERVPDESVLYHASRNHFSTWLTARGHFELAESLVKFRMPDLPPHEAAESIRQTLIRRIRAHTSRPVTNFDSSAVQWSSRIARIGHGSLGGKGRGFRFLNTVLEQYGVETLVPNVRIIVPRSLIIAAQEFDQFISADHHRLKREALEATDDATVAKLFLDTPLPLELQAKLRHHLKLFVRPIAIRSSSLFEDAFQQPFAGVYNTYLLGNNHPDPEVRLADLSAAVKMVWASTFFQEARTYASATHHRIEEEKMACIIQEVTGQQHDHYFFPALSGVAVAVDFYPLPHTRKSDGSCTVSPGLGAAVMDGISNVRFSLGDPTHPTGLATEDNTTLLALDLDIPSDWSKDWKQQHNLVHLSMVKARELGAHVTVPRSRVAPVGKGADVELTDVHGIKRVAPTVNSETAHTTSDLVQEVSIKQLIAGETFPLADIVSFLLRTGSAGLACPVEIEFAVNLSRSPSEPHEFTILQVRPMSALADSSRPKLKFSHLPESDAAAVASGRALGHGSFEGIKDVVFVRDDLFTRDNTVEVASEVGRLNDALRAEGRPYILIGPGRWGTADARNGVPVTWSQINGATFIVETDIAGTSVPPSQGSHFFQNVMSFGIGYLTVDRQNPNTREVVDLSWFGQQKEAGLVPDLKLTRHVRFDEPLEVVVDGLSQCGVVMKPGKSFAEYVGQFDAFLSIAEQEGM